MEGAPRVGPRGWATIPSLLIGKGVRVRRGYSGLVKLTVGKLQVHREVIPIGHVVRGLGRIGTLCLKARQQFLIHVAREVPRIKT